MDWNLFRSTYAPTTGPLRLGQWTCTDEECPATRLGPQPRNYQATLAIGDRISVASAAASRPGRGADGDAVREGHPRRDDRVPPAPERRRNGDVHPGSDGAHAEWAWAWTPTRRNRR